MTLSELVVRHRLAVSIFWVLLAAVCAPFAIDISSRLVVGGDVPGGEAMAVQSSVALDFGRDAERLLALVMTGVPDARAAQQLTARIVERLERFEWIDDVELRQVGASGEDSVMVVRLDDAIGDSAALESLESLTADVGASISPRFASARLLWTGEMAVREDIIKASTVDLRKSELRALPLSFFILCFVFGALVAAALPLGIGLVSTLLTLAFAGFLAEFVEISVMVQSVASLLGLALGIDYSLLVISQFRKELVGAANARGAAAGTLAQCGKTVVVSGAAVSIGFAGLALVPVDNLRSIGIAGMAVAAFAALLTTTALPVALSWLGDRIDRGRLWRRRGVETSERWYRWAAYVCGHPWRIAAVSTLPLLALGLLARDLEAAFPSDSWLPPSAPSIAGLTRLKEMGEAGAMNRLLVLYELPDDIMMSERPAMAALRRLHIHLNDDARAETVLSAVSFGLGRNGLVQAPESLRHALLSDDGRTALLEVTPVSSLDTGGELTRFVRDIRSIDVGAVTGLGGRVRVGGTPAATADYEDLVDRWLPRVIGLVALGSFVVLALAFRSLVIPLKAVALNLLSVFAAYGTIVAIFVHGFGLGLFGLTGPIDGIFPPIPIIVFCAAFGISMDYEVFMLSSIAKARDQRLDERACVVEGVARTGRLITRAASIMIVVFGAFAFGEMLPTQILGTALAAVVAVDALLIRIALGPAVIQIAGRWNWWPGGSTRSVPPKD